MSSSNSNTFDLDAIVSSKFPINVESKVNYNTQYNGAGFAGGNTTRINNRSASNSAVQRPANGRSIEELLAKYNEVPRDAWHDLKKGDYIRYKNEKGELKPGGTVRSIINNPDNTISIQLFKKMGAKFANFAINASKTQNIYLFDKQYSSYQPNQQQSDQADNRQAQQHVQGGNAQDNQQKKSHQEKLLVQLGDKLLSDDGESLKNRLDAQEVRTQRIEQDLKKLFLLVKKMYDANRSQG